MGVFVYSFFKIFIDNQIKLKYCVVLIMSVLMFLIIKPYILLLVVLPLVLFAFIQRKKMDIFNLKKITVFYFISMLFIFNVVFFVLKYGFQKDIIETIVVRQNDFINLSKGGTFFLNDEKYVRFEITDTTHYEKTDSISNTYKLKPHSAFMYWKSNNLRDTIFETNNRDTADFRFISRCTPSGSAINMERLSYSFTSFLKIIPISFVNVIAKPFFYDAKSILELMASFENLCFLLFFIICFVYRTKVKVDKNVVILCVTIVISSFILIGLTTTVSGAIVRYRVPFLPFLLMIPLLYLDENQLRKIPLIKRLVK